MGGMGMGTAQQPAQKIIAYGHNASHFANPEAIIHFIEEDIVENRRRYHYTRYRDADIIVLSLGGFAYGHFEIRDQVAPDDRDRHEFRSVKRTYIVGRRARYSQPVRLMSLEIRVYPWGAPVSLEQFEQTKEEAGHIEEFP
jgi:hypothetical protein